MKQGYTHVTFVLDNSGSMYHLRKDTIGGYNSFREKQLQDPGKMTFSLYQFNREYNSNYAVQAPLGHPAIPPQMIRQPAVANGQFGIGTVLTGGGQPLPAVTSIGVVGVASPLPEYGVASMNATPGMFYNTNTASNALGLKPGTVSVTYEFVDLKSVPELSEATYACDTNTPLLDAIGYGIDQTGKLLAALSEEERPEKVIFVILTDGEENSSQVYSHEQVKAKIKTQTDEFNWDFLYLGANQDAIQTGSSYGIIRGRSMNFVATAASATSSYNAISDTVKNIKTAAVSKNVNFDDTIRAAVMDGTYTGK